MTYTDFVKTVESTSWHEVNHRLFHATVGLCTEVGELLEVEGEQHLLEELGDVFWYLALGFDSIGYNFENCPHISDQDFQELVRGDAPLDSLVIYTTEVLDLCKKSLFYGRVIKHEEVHVLLVWIKNCLERSIEQRGNFTVQQVLDANMKKLQVRYPGKFTEAAAINRDVKEEYAAMNR